MESLFVKKVRCRAIPQKIYKRMNKKGELTVIAANSPSALMANGSNRTPSSIVNPLKSLDLLLAPRAGLGHYSRNNCFSLRNLPFGFLTQHVVGLFLPDRSAESSLRVLQKGKSANKKSPC